MYGYILNDPINLIDVTGLKAMPADFGANPADLNNPLAQRYGLGEGGVAATYPDLAFLAALKLLYLEVHMLEF